MSAVWQEAWLCCAILHPHYERAFAPLCCMGHSSYTKTWITDFMLLLAFWFMTVSCRVHALD